MKEAPTLLAVLRRLLVEPAREVAAGTSESVA
jgi:hypothetical protein